MVWSAINYGSCIWGTRDFSCINTVQNRAMIFFMGVGKYTPNDAIAGDMGWKPVYIRQWSNIFRHCARCSIMQHDRMNFKVFKWSIKKDNGRTKNSGYRICEMLRAQNIEHIVILRIILLLSILFCKLNK